MSALEKLNEIFREVFDDEEITVAPETTANDVDGWDSLSHVNLIMAIEGKFAIRFAQKELLSFKCVNDMLRCIEAKVAG